MPCDRKNGLLLKEVSAEEILNLISEHIWWVDKDGHYLGCNQSQAKDIGLNSPEEIIGKTVYNFRPQKTAEELRGNDLAVMKSGVPATFVEEDYISTKMPLYNEYNHVMGILGVSIHVKEYKDRVDRTHHILDEIIAAMPGHVYWKDRNGILQGCNEQQAIDVGLKSRSEIVGKNDSDILNKNLPEEIKKQHAAAITTADNEVMDSGVEKIFEESAILPDGKVLTYLSQKKPLHDDKGEVIGLLGISVDITELKKAKEQAEAANHAKTEFVQNMQHDIRTPSAGLWGVLDVLAKTEPDSDRKEALDMAVAASKRLLDLCNEAVEFGDLSGNMKPVVQKSLDIRELLRSVIELNKPAAFAKDLIINFKVAASVPPHIVSDEFRISRIFINLLGNAIKFSHQGTIAVSVDASLEEDTRKGFLTIVLKDMGIGIAADKIDSVFEKFTRGVASNTNQYPGTGLGLYIVKTFMDELNGDIYLDSHENEGTYFKINIPFRALLEDMKKPGVEIEEQFKSTMKQNSAAQQSRQIRVQKKSLANTPFTHELLIIEDDKTCLFAEKNLLSAFTLHIDTAESVAEALEKLASKRYDLVISDLGLPDGSGNDIVAKIKANAHSANYHTPFVAMTAHQDALKHQQAMAAGFTATHTKPLGSEKALELLNTYSARESVTLAQEMNTPPKAVGYPVIDLILGMQRISAITESQALEVLSILWETLQTDIPLLQQTEENNDIEGAKALLLKIRGSLCYTGTPRLEAACELLYNETMGDIKDLRKMQALFSVFYDEVKLFIEQFKDLIRGVNAEKEAEHLRLVNETQKALLSQEERFRTIVNHVVHDIRSPLSTLLMTVKSCTHIPEGDRITLREAATGIGDIANHLLHQYRKKDSNEAMAHEECQAMLVSTVLLESLTHKKYQYEGLPIQFNGNFEANTQFAFIKIQVSAFKRMLSNLMNNAVDAFDGQQGTVCLRLEADNEWVKIHIQDTGKGMPTDLIQKILKKTAVTQDKPSGHGLGLTQVWETLEQNQGELEINSTPGVGTILTVTFPRITAPHWIAEEMLLNTNDTVVILDDDSSIHGAWDACFETLLNENATLQLKHFQLGKEALAFIETLSSDEKEHVFLLSDYELLKQDLNGIEVIAKSGLQRCMLVTSHYADPELQKEVARMGVHILPKQLAAEIAIKMKHTEDVKAEKVYAVVVDDNRTFVKTLLLYAFKEEQMIETYYDPKHFLENAPKYPKDTKIYLDNNYNTSTLTGLVVAKKLHELGYTQLYILSGEAFLDAPPYVTVIGKNDMERLKNL